MSNSNYNTNSNSSPYSHLYDDAPNLSIGKDMIDPYSANKKSQTGTMTNYFTNTPSNVKISSQHSEPNLINKYQYNQSNEYKQFSKSSTSNKTNLTYPPSHISQDYKKMYIEKVSNDINLLPNQYKDPIKRLNHLFVTISCVYPLYALFYIVKDYPEITALSKRRFLFSSFIYAAFFLFVNNFNHKQYDRSYKFLRNVYTEEEINNMVSQYHDANSQQLINQFFVNQDTGMNNQNTKY
jgi:hypothetical protein